MFALNHRKRLLKKFKIIFSDKNVLHPSNGNFSNLLKSFLLKKGESGFQNGFANILLGLDQCDQIGRFIGLWARFFGTN